METASFFHCLSASNVTTSGGRTALLNIGLFAHRHGHCYQTLAETTSHRWGPLVGWGEAGSTGIGTLPLEESAERPAQGQQEEGTGHCQHHHEPGLRLPESLCVCHKQRHHH